MLDVKNSKTFPLKKRKHKVNFKKFAKISNHKTTIGDFMKSLPQILAANDFQNIVKAIKKSKLKKKPIVWGLGAHVIKTGLNPIFIQLMKKGYVNAIALNGAGIIHDTELALVGETSEEVIEGISNGTFGMVRETGEFINKSINLSYQKNKGIGEVLGSQIIKNHLPYKDHSILAWASKLRIPVTVHVSIGTDIIHMHPNADGKAIGEASLKDFMIFSGVISKMKNGGIFLNVGSNVILPEVFLKAITMARNQGHKIGNFDVAVFDFNLHYRPLVNVVKRPVEVLGGKGYYIIGHHEILIPLLSSTLL